MTASERILAALKGLLTHFSALSLTGWLINLALTATVIALAWAAGRVARRLTLIGAHRLPGPADAEKTVRTHRLARLAGFTVRSVSSLLAVLVAADIWGFNLLAWTATPVGAQILAGLLRLVLLLIVAVAAFELVGLAIGRAMGGFAERADEPRRRAQLATLAPLLRGITQTAIVVVAVLMALSELGVKIGPLLAGAGVVGVALGFGAQTLVKDFLTGIFLIVEDIVSVGDIVRIGDSGGLVEQMTLRTIRLRDFDGTVHVFPYSEAQVLHNLTKSFSYYVFDLQVSYSSDLDAALAIMKRVGARLKSDPNFADKILEPIEVVGVDNLADSGVVLKARIKTIPIQQWTVGREYNRRIKLAFDEAGVEIPFPHLKVVMPEQQIAELTATRGAPN
ncbi:mechanosensitive ion channel family protein [Caulobacter sp. X]|uniref:mechanosensitive ion channel family protein n=1 Tax=Caulobacter sp. X TaxID=2048901 RepID=UPI000C155807|nr:mechanosensitive ion channel family protein [Caulobacter sp. X]PIB96863.1 mechanosensitive ion channel protein MscS [Caulobacter sp. X]